jgi:hypothetical protein
MCFAEHVFFAWLGARSVAPQRRAFPRRAAQRRVQCTQYVHNVFTEPTGRKCVPARANRRRTRTGIALLTVHNSSSRFLCPWHRACSASPCLPRSCKVAPCFETWCMDSRHFCGACLSVWHSRGRNTCAQCLGAAAEATLSRRFLSRGWLN